MASMTLEEALRELEFLFKPGRYPSHREAWEIVREYALDGQRNRESQAGAMKPSQVEEAGIKQSS